MNLTDIVQTKNKDVKNGRNTYITPSKSFDGFTKGELIWVKSYDDSAIVVFRPMDGNEHIIEQQFLKYFKLTGR